MNAINPHDPTSDASRIRLALDLLGWSQTDLAWRLFRHRTTIRDWCRGREIPPPEVMEWIEASSAALAAQPLPKGWHVDATEEYDEQQEGCGQ